MSARYGYKRNVAVGGALARPVAVVAGAPRVAPTGEHQIHAALGRERIYAFHSTNNL